MKLAEVWFTEVKKLQVDEAIFLRVANKAEQKDLAAALEKQRDKFAEIDPIHASQLFVNQVLKNMKQWVVVERKYRAPFTAFFKSADGEMSKLSIDPERHRQLTLMIKDKKTREEIEEAMNGLKDEEIEEFFKEEE